MKYCILEASVARHKVATHSLLKPFEDEVYYIDEGQIMEFDTPEEAIEYLYIFMPLTEHMAIPGSREALEMYQSLWMGTGEACLHNLEKLTLSFSDKENIRWDYGQDDVDSLAEAMQEFDELDEPRDADAHPGEYVVGSHLLGDSELLRGRSCFMMMLNVDLDFEKLPRCEQEMVIVPDTIDKKRVTIDEGKMFDLWCMYQCNFNKPKAIMLAWRLYLVQMYGMKTYKIKNKCEELVYSFNKFRLKKGWY